MLPDFCPHKTEIAHKILTLLDFVLDFVLKCFDVKCVRISLMRLPVSQRTRVVQKSALCQISKKRICTEVTDARCQIRNV